MTYVIAVINRKGGIGKSTAVATLAGALAVAGKRVLAVDFDPQATLTVGLLGDAETYALPAERTGAALFGAGFPDPNRLIVPTRFERLSLLPASPALDEFNSSRPTQDGRQFVLRDFLIDVGAAFDRVLIDCPPNLYALSAIAAAAADGVLCPTRADPDGVAAISFVNAEVARIKAGVNPGLTMLGYLLGAFKKRNAIHIAYSARLRRDFGSLVLTNEVPDAAVFVDARAAQTPISYYKPGSAAAKTVALIAIELEDRIALALSVTPKRKEAA